MPLKIESGTYTVNPVPKKNTSKFLLWKHWRRRKTKTTKQQQQQKRKQTRCSVHEDRGEDKPSSRDRRRSNVDRDSTRRCGVGGAAELPGLEEFGDSCVATVTSSVPGAGLSSGRRTRPLSLAVQPLNYHRLDPDATGDELDHHLLPNMTSQESIGSCSLDVDRSVSDRSENTIDSVSERTLHSLNLSCNGEPISTAENLVNGSSETLQKSHLTPDDKVIVSNGHRCSPEPEQLTAKKPSYLGLACSISGYSGITRYDSKLREGFRSRDSSPGTRLITRDTSPAGFKSNENLSVPIHHYPPKSQSISPLAMDRQNGFANGMKEECKIETYRETRNSMSICQGFSEVDKGVSIHTTFPDVSPIRVNSSSRRSPGIVQVMSCGQQTKSFSSSYAESSPKPSTINISNSSFSDTSILNGSNVEIEHQITNTSSSSEKSFIQQRVERLYGPGALAQGFFFKRSVTKLNVTDNSFNKFSSNSDNSTDNVNTEESLKNLPVLRHLRPEFRAQLPVVSSRKPTDGSEQIIKPLRRISPAPRKTEQQSKVCKTSHVSESVAESSNQHNNSIASIPDQQPAAPKVVLPVLEPSASSSNVAKQMQELEKTTEEKNGHYFLKLLKQETDRLLSLAASAEAELAGGDPVALPEEAAGKLRSAAGKARLLASQKMQQFEGLCQKNINQVPGEEFPTTNEDLAGFWDMVMLQVVQVNELFDQIEKSRKSQWQEVCPVYIQSKSPSPLKSRHRRKKSVPLPKSPVEKKPVDNIPKNVQECVSKELKPSRACHFLHNTEKIFTESDDTNIHMELYVSDYNDEVSDVKNMMEDKLTAMKQNIIIVERCIPEYTNHARFFNPNLKSFYEDDKNLYSNILPNDDIYKPKDAKINMKDNIRRSFKERFTTTDEEFKQMHNEDISAQTSFLSIGEPTTHVERRRQNILDFPIRKPSYSILKPTIKSGCMKSEIDQTNYTDKQKLINRKMKYLESNVNDVNITKENQSENITSGINFSSRPSISSSLRKQNSKKFQYNVTFSDEVMPNKIKKPLFDDRTYNSIIHEDNIGNNINIHDKSNQTVFKETNINLRPDKEVMGNSMVQLVENQISNSSNYSISNNKTRSIKSPKENTEAAILMPEIKQKSKINLYKKLNNTRTIRRLIEKPKGIRKNGQKNLQNDNNFKKIVSNMFKNKYNIITPNNDNNSNNNNNDDDDNDDDDDNNEKIIKPGTSMGRKSYTFISSRKNKKEQPIKKVDPNDKNSCENSKRIVDPLNNAKRTVNKFANRSLNKSIDLARTKIEVSSSKQLKSRFARSQKKFSIVTDVWSNVDSVSLKNNVNESSTNNLLTKPNVNEKVYKKMQIKKDIKRDENVVDQEKKYTKPRQKSPHAIVWSQSDSQPFIPLSQETLKQLGRMYRIDKVKQYDQKRKESLKINKLFSNDTIINNYQDNPRGYIVMETDYFLPNDTDFSTECEFISSNNPNRCLASGDDDKTLYLFDIKNLSEKRKELQRFVSSIVTSLNTKVSNKNTSSKLLTIDEHKYTYDVPSKSDIKNKLSYTKEWDCNKLISSRSIATFSLYTSNDGMMKSLKSFETDTGLALKACDPMDSNVSIKSLRDKDEEFYQKMKFFLESDKYFPLNRKCIEICDVVPEKKSNASLSQNGNAAKRRITPVHKTKPTANSEANKKAREAREQARRQMIEERRRAMRSNIQNQDNSVKIFAPET
ncbi:hypothetical protein V1478_011914 [Vespula squamosa]|uniref:Disks large-associated protein 5 n=1 Tax=Vespula squamosa TaxID=30214 RepID=A0ABD2ABP3_VESSQ